MKKALRGAGVALFWIGVWEALALLVGHPLLLPGPGATLAALLRLGATAAFWQNVGVTLLRVLAGFVLGVLTGMALAVGCWKWRGFDALMSPLGAIVKATPVTSFIILVILWLSRAHVPVFIAFLMVMPIVWTAVRQALMGVDANLVEMADAYRFSPMQKARYLYAPAIRPAFAAACITALGFAWKSGIAAEVIALPDLAVGRRLYDAKIYLEREELFAWTLTVILLSMALERLLRWAMDRSKGGDGYAGD